MSAKNISWSLAFPTDTLGGTHSKIFREEFFFIYIYIFYELFQKKPRWLEYYEIRQDILGKDCQNTDIYIKYTKLMGRDEDSTSSHKYFKYYKTNS